MANNTLELVIKAQDHASKELKKIEKQVKWMQGTFKKTWKSVSDFWKRNAETFKKIWIGVGIAVTAIGVMWKQFLDIGTSIELTWKKAAVVFWDYIDDVKAVWKETAKAMWLSQNEYLAAASWVQDLLVPMWFARDEAAKMTTDMLGLAGALAEWSGWTRTATEVSEILTKAMLWETEQLKTMGIQLDISSKQFNERIKLVAEETGVTLQQAKALDIQNQILAKSVDAQNAYKEWAGSLARQQAELTATIKDARDSIAVALIPAMNTLIETMAPVIQDLATTVQLWAENKENIEWLKDTMVSTIEVFKTIGDMIQWIITLLWWLIKPFQEAVNSIALLAANVVIFFWNMTWSLNSWSENTKSTIESVKSFFSGLFSFLFPQFDFFVKKINILKDAYASIKSAIWLWWSSVDWARANGWPVNANGSYIVWEKGPELFTPSSSWNITPNNQLGTSSININMWWVSVSNEADENRLVEKIKMSLTDSLQMNKFWVS